MVFISEALSLKLKLNFAAIAIMITIDWTGLETGLGDWTVGLDCGTGLGGLCLLSTDYSPVTGAHKNKGLGVRNSGNYL